MVLSGEGVGVGCLAESEKFCDVWRRGRVFVVFRGKGELVCCLLVRERWCGV